MKRVGEQARGLEVEVDLEEEQVALRVRGELDEANVELLQVVLAATGEAQTDVVDMAESAFVDLRSLMVLARCAQERTGAGKELILLDPPPSGEIIIRAIGMEAELPAVRRTSRADGRQESLPVGHGADIHGDGDRGGASASVLRLLATLLRVALVMAAGLALVLAAPVAVAAVIVGKPLVAVVVLVVLLAVVAIWAVQLAPVGT